MGQQEIPTTTLQKIRVEWKQQEPVVFLAGLDYNYHNYVESFMVLQDSVQNGS